MFVVTEFNPCGVSQIDAIQRFNNVSRLKQQKAPAFAAPVSGLTAFTALSTAPNSAQWRSV